MLEIFHLNKESCETQSCIKKFNFLVLIPNKNITFDSEMESPASQHQKVSLDDQEFVSGVNRRAPDSFRRLYSSLDKPLIRFSNKYLNCTPDAEDIVHDVFIQFWQSKYTFTDIKSIRSFLFTATKNRSLNYLKRRRKVVNNIAFLEFEAADERTSNFFDLNYEIKALFDTSLGQLPSECKKIMNSFKEGMNSLEIAIRYKLAPSTVRAQKRRGIELIRTFFNRRLSSQLFSRY